MSTVIYAKLTEKDGRYAPGENAAADYAHPMLTKHWLFDIVDTENEANERIEKAVSSGEVKPATQFHLLDASKVVPVVTLVDA